MITFSISLMFIVFGNYMGKIRHNYFVGIKTPSVLKPIALSDHHRQGGINSIALSMP
jgi:hypothetical protein